MAEKELKRMSRPELIEIIYALQQNEEKLMEETKNEREAMQKEIQMLQEKLDDRLIKIEQAGSIADAAMQVNDIFTVAQKAADEYLSSVYAQHATAQARAEHIIEEAKAQAEAIIAEAQIRKDTLQKEADVIILNANEHRALLEMQTEKIVQNKWDHFERKVQELLNNHKELSELMRRG